MEKLGLIAKPYQSAMPEETQTTVDYFVPYFLKIKPPEEILNTKGNKAKYSSKLCITTKSGFLPNTIFNKLLAACIQNFKPSGPPGRKHIYCGCGVFDVGTNCHQLFVCFADHVIHIWFSRLSSHENPDNLECKKISDFILNILRQDLKEDVIFYKCWKASVESKVKLFQENLPQNNEVICYCQNDGHSVKYSEITQYWQTQIQENADNVLASSDLVLPSSSQSTPQQESSCALSGQPFRKESDKTLLNQSMIAALNEQMKSVGVLISNGDVMGTVFRIGSKYVMTAYHVVKCIIDPHNTRSYDVSQLYNKRNTFVHFNESAVLSDRSSSVKKLVMFTEYLDVAVLKIKKEHDGHLPPKMVLSKFRFVGSDVSLIGYGNPNNSNRKHIDLRCEVVKPNSRRMLHVLQSLLQNNSHYKAVLQVCGQDPGLVDIGYRGYDNESQLMFDCYMQFGASGAPMLTNNNEGDIQVVGVFTHGLPEFFFKLPDSERQKFLPFYLLDGGSKMEYIYKWIHDNYHDYVNEFFN